MRRIAGWTVWLLLASLPLCGCGTDSSRSAQSADSSPPAFEPLGKVFVIGLDGADWQIIDRLEQQGRLPNLARLRRGGAWGVLRSEKPLLSPIVWTSIATGRHPLDHGIVGFLTVREGKTEPVRSDERRVPAFWNLAGRMGFRVGVVGWYTSWPAESVNGFLVSDRIGYHQVRGSAAPARSGLVHPPVLYDEIEPMWSRIEEGLGPEATGRFFPGGPGASVAVEQERLDTFVGILRTTELYRALTPWLIERYDPDLMAVYFEGTDSVGHLFAEYAPPPLPGIDPRQIEQLGGVFDRYYDYIDTVVGEIVSGLDPAETTLLVVSDHGFKSGDARPRAPTRSAHGDQAPLWHRPEGVLLMWGRGVRAGVELPESSIFDVLPTALRALGAPIALNLQGRPVDEAFTSELLAHPVRGVDDYGGMDERGEVADLELPTDEVMAKLRALGYVGPAGATGAGTSAGTAAGVTAEGQASLPLNRYNLGVVLLNDGKRAEALEVFRSLQDEAPQFALGFLGEGLVLLQQDRPDEAARKLEQAVVAGSQFPAVHAALGEAYLGLGRAGDAATAFRRALELDAGDGRSALLLARIELRGGNLERARGLFDAASRFTDNAADRAGAFIGLAVLAEEESRLEEAAGRYEDALRIHPDHPRALERYGNLELFRGNTEHAIELLGRLVEISGEDPRKRRLYDRALAIAGRDAEARAVR